MKKYVQIKNNNRKKIVKIYNVRSFTSKIPTLVTMDQKLRYIILPVNVHRT